MIIEQTISPLFSDKLTTFEIVTPKYLLGEIGKHRLLAMSAASARAIPFKKLLKSIREDPFIPKVWQMKHPGMQGKEYIKDQKTLNKLELQYLTALDAAATEAEKLEAMGITKQIPNRIIEPFMQAKVVLTGTEWDNWFKLRGPQYQTPVQGNDFFFNTKKEVLDCHSNPINQQLLEEMDEYGWLEIAKGAAEPHFRFFVEEMAEAYQFHIPKSQDQHIPYLIEHDELDEITKKKMYSASRIARTSYLTIDGDSKTDIEANLDLAKDLLRDKHSVPFEHQMRVMREDEYFSFSRTYLTKEVTHKIEEETGTGQSDILKKGNSWEVTEYGWCKQYRGFIPFRDELGI